MYLPLNTGLNTPLKRELLLSITVWFYTKRVASQWQSCGHGTVSKEVGAFYPAFYPAHWTLHQVSRTASIRLSEERSSLERLCISAFDFCEDVRISIGQSSMNREGGFARYPNGKNCLCRPGVKGGQGNGRVQSRKRSLHLPGSGNAGHRQHRTRRTASPKYWRITVEVPFFSEDLQTFK